MPALASATRARGARRPSVVLLVSVALAALFTMLLAPAGPAHAAAYRYWGYYQLKDGAWAFANKGPSQITPKDGSVEGWRFAISGAGKEVRDPRAVLTFDEICGDTEPADGKKRVGVVLDFGRAVDAEGGVTPPEPVAECAVVPEAAHSDEVLAAVADVRAEKDLVCAIDGYPERGCGDEVKDVPEAATQPDQAVQIPVAGGAADSAAAPAPTTAAPTTGSATQAAGATPSSPPSSQPSATGAGQADGQATAAGDRSESDSGTGAGTWIGIAVVVLAVLGVAAVALRRRTQA